MGNKLKLALLFIITILSSCSEKITNNFPLILVAENEPYEVRIDYIARYRRNIEVNYAGSISPDVDINPSITIALRTSVMTMSEEEFLESLEDGALVEALNKYLEEDVYTEGIKVLVRDITIIKP